jgi:hypothetical protein
MLSKTILLGSAAAHRLICMKPHFAEIGNSSTEGLSPVKKGNTPQGERFRNVASLTRRLEELKMKLPLMKPEHGGRN